MQAIDNPAHGERDVTHREAIAAFRDVHGRHLHGFAILLTLGDRRAAAALAAGALADATTRVDELRHPERAAAWLRAHVLRGARRARSSSSPSGLAALETLDVPRPVGQALAGVGLVERAALIAGIVEGLDRRDVATVVGRDGESLERLLGRARRRYAAAYASAGGGSVDGPLAGRIRAIADRAMA
jgi:DNA-directed RNA polymerase specialized sigma24 family protein